MVTLSPLAKLPIPELVDRLDGPTAFSNFAKRNEDITVIPYANATARTAAYAGVAPPRSPTAGTVTYLIDVGNFEFWNGTAWQPIYSLDLPRGIIAAPYSTANWPADSSYIAQNQERLHELLRVTTNVVAGRMYRLTVDIGVLDGGPGSSPTSGGAYAHIKYNASTTPPTAASPWLVYTHAPVLSDDSKTSGGIHMSRCWSPPATSTYTFQFTLRPDAVGGARIWGSQQMVIEDVGRIPPTTDPNAKAR